MGIAHGSRSDFIRTGAKSLAGVDLTGIQCFGDSKRLHGRTWFNHIDNGAVAALFVAYTAGLVRVVGGAVGQGKDFARLYIQYDDRIGFGLMIVDGFV